MKPLLGSPLHPSVYLRSSGQCDTDSLTAQIGCATLGAPDGSVTLRLPAVEAGTWYLWVDGQQATAGAFDLSLTFEAPTPCFVRIHSRLWLPRRQFHTICFSDNGATSAADLGSDLSGRPILAP